MIMFGLLSTKKKYNDIVKPFIAMSPVMSLTNIKSPVKYLANRLVMRIFESRGGQFHPSSSFLRVLSNYCPSRFSKYCSNPLFLLIGFNEEQFNKERSSVHLSHFPQGMSSKNMVHFMQAIRNGQFAMYDLGSAGNWYRYGQEKPPLYPIEEITCKNIAFISSMNDWLSSPEDVDLLRRRLTVALVDD
jgi:lysosomal acid lipase/cholesteryl ester hydrolase